jgi:peroxiredoxin
MSLVEVWKKLPQSALWMLLLLILAGSNALLIRQNVRMRAELNSFKPSVLEPGDKVPSFSARGLDGEQLHVNFTGKEPRRILLFFSPGCPYCREQFAYWQQLLTKSDSNRFEVLGLVAQSEDRIKLDQYLQAVNVSPGLRVALVPDELRRAYKLSRTPITLVVANDGKVENVWTGKWNSDILAKAADIFNINFSTLSAKAELSTDQSCSRR